MANLVIDIGNTLIKIAVFADGKLLQVKQYEQVDPEVIVTIITDHKIKRGIVSSVIKQPASWVEVIAQKIPLQWFNVDNIGSIKNHYLTTATLGLDRLASVIGAHTAYPGKNNLVIDSGTCIKYEWVDAEGNYFGGSISPGLKMRYKALNYYTDALPLIEEDIGFERSFGNDTRTAIRSGVQNGIKYELMGFIEGYYKNHQEINIILSGGDCLFFDTLLKNSIFARYIKIEPHLVLKGLNAAIQDTDD
jgi:type III pantothenate kinase